MTSPKEATALQSEIDSISRRQSVLEDQIIEVMEQIEPFALEEARIVSQRNAGGESRQKLEKQLAETQDEIEGQREAVIKERVHLEERAGADLVALYEQNRIRMGDHTAVGRLVGTSCGACFLGISAVELDRIRRLPSNEPSECPECGALLIR
jgi:predicted  nucleic acid-binding Zn-ribbon protein